MYSYDRRTAASTDLRSEWKDIVQKHEKAEQEEFDALIKKAVPYLKSVGYDLVLKDSYLGKKNSGSDGTRMTGQIVVKEREENNTQAKDGRGVSRWLEEALGLYGSAKKQSEGPEKSRSGEPLITWVVDLDES
jgi:hypothetical protein